MGMGKFRPPTKSIPLNRSTKKLAVGTVDYVHEGIFYTKFGTNPPWASGKMGEI